MKYSSVAILGPGLLGGSVALAVREAGGVAMLWGRNPKKVAQTKDLGLEATTDLAEAVSGADLVVLAVPVGVMEELVEKMIPHLAESCMVTDVGSVKALPHEKVGKLLERSGVDFVGSHPMAGSEQTGMEAARADLFQGAACVLTNDQGVEGPKVADLSSFWEALGCRPRQMTAQGHDRAVARISHFPHAMAVLTAEAGLKFSGDAALAGGGFRDTSRVASGNPEMWAEIMIENSTALAEALRDAGESLRELLVMLENSDEEGLRTFLAEIKTRRDAVR